MAGGSSDDFIPLHPLEIFRLAPRSPGNGPDRKPNVLNLLYELGDMLRERKQETLDLLLLVFE